MTTNQPKRVVLDIPSNEEDPAKPSGTSHQRKTAMSSSSSSSPQTDDRLSVDSKTSSCESSGKTDVKSATINMVKGFIGVGILALPSGFAKSGWLGGILFFAIVSISVFYLSLRVVEAAAYRKSRARSATEFWVECMGKEHRLMANVFLFTIQLGICIAYMIFFVTYFQESLCFFVDYDKSSFLCYSRIPSLFVSVCLCAPSIFIRQMANLKLWSMVANTLIIFSLGVVIIASMTQMKISYITSEYITAVRWSDIGSAIGIFIFAFEGTTLYFEVRQRMNLNSIANTSSFSINRTKN